MKLYPLFSNCLCTFLVCIFSQALLAQNEVPQIENLQVSVDEVNKVLQINYDLSDSENDPSTISLQISTDEGLSYQNINQDISGDIGATITPGNNKQINWSYTDFFALNGMYQLRLIADDEQPVDIAALVAQVDSQRLRSDLEAIAGVRHATAGAAQLAATKDSIRDILGRQGLPVREQSWMRGNYEAHNIIGQHHGIEVPQRVYIVDAHYDSVDDAPGADDNGSGTVGFLEVARIISQYPTRKSIEFIGFDLEEEGLLGSIQYLNDGRIPGDTIQGVLNFEMIGYYSEEPNSQQFPNGFNLLYPDAYNAVAADNFRGNFITNVGDNQSLDLITAYTDAITQYVPDLKEISISANAGGFYVPDLLRSDHAPFWLQNIPALMLTDGANFRNPYYHTPDDTIDKLNFTFMRRVVQATVATIAELAEVRHASTASGSFEVSTITATRDLADCAISFYPQPSNSELQIDLKQCSVKWQQVELLDINGKSVFSQKTNSTQQNIRINTTELPAGLYFLIFKGENQQVARKVSVMR